jgi:DNA modification methylase
MRTASDPKTAPPPIVREAYRTERGKLLHGRIEDALEDERMRRVKGKVDLIFTSPPFPLVRKKKYGNRTGDEYLQWLRSLAPKLKEMLSPTGSLVLEIGNAWIEGSPEMSTLPLRALLAFQEAAELHLCQHLICHNPARLPTPAQWVTIKRIRLKDSFTHVWWMSPNSEPDADNKRVLLPYSGHMQSLLRSKKYNAGARPSGHVISQSGFLTNHGGAIAPSVLDLHEDADRVPSAVLPFSNTGWDASYVEYCKTNDIPAHPARMRPDLVAFFVEFLTNPGALVLDPFAGSNTTGAVAEKMKRRWICVEAEEKYVEGSRGRFGKLLGVEAIA